MKLLLALLVLLPLHLSAAASPLLGVLLCNQAPGTNSTPPGGGTGLTNSLVAVWNMEQASGAEAPDATGNGKTLSAVGSTVRSTTRLEGSFSGQGGAAAYWTITNSAFNAFTNFGWSGWVNFQGNTPDGSWIAGVWGGAKGWICYVDGNVFNLRLRNALDDGSYIAISSVAINDANWHHVLCSYNGTNQIGTISVDNETAVSTAKSDGLNLNVPFHLNNAAVFTLIDQSAYWSRVMTFGASSDQSNLIGTFNFATQSGTPLWYPSW